MYDTYAKSILTYKIILANILISCIPAFYGIEPKAASDKSSRSILSFAEIIVENRMLRRLCNPVLVSLFCVDADLSEAAFGSIP